MSSYFNTFYAFVKAHVYISVGAAVIILIGIGTILSFMGGEASVSEVGTNREVVVAKVSDIMNGGGALSLVGDVRSVSEAKISTEASGRITRVNVALGSIVGAGSILAEIENSAQRAAVLQAEGALEAARASLPNLDSSLENARGSAVTTLLGAYAAVENSIRDAVDPLLSNPEHSTPTFVVLTTDSQAKITIENDRGSFNQILARHKTQAASVTVSSDLIEELARTETEVRKTQVYIETVLKALNDAIDSPTFSASDRATALTEATGARTSLNTSLAAINAARSALLVADNNANGSSGISAASASLKQAEGTYNASLAALEKTRIRAPIAGTINNFTLKLGDTVSPGMQVAVVSNNSALEIIAFVTEDERSRLSVGETVTIEGGVKGTVTKIAPALDPVTRRIEVRIGLPSRVEGLVNGQSVRVTLHGAPSKPHNGPFRIPITALRIETDRTVVFTVNASSTLTALPVEIGALTGDYVEVRSGLSSDTEIVVDVRGLQEGDTVSVR